MTDRWVGICDDNDDDNAGKPYAMLSHAGQCSCERDVPSLLKMM